MDYARRCSEPEMPEGVDEVACFQYQRMLRYGGAWHLETRTLLPGCVFLSGTGRAALRRSGERAAGGGGSVSLVPCEAPYARELCREGHLIPMSKGAIRDGRPVVTAGPLKGREDLIRNIDRHKRIAEIEIPLAGDRRRVTVGLEIYEKR